VSDMSNLVPFTREDMLLLLTGDHTRMIHLFIACANAWLKDIETITGRTPKAMDLLHTMGEGSKSFFKVPSYFYDAWMSAAHTNTFHGWRIESWDREFIKAFFDTQEVQDKLTAADIGPINLTFVPLEPR
jgi:hypothetical protein